MVIHREAGPCFIMTHNQPQEWLNPDSPFTFITDGVESAVRQAQQATGGKNISISSASIAQQCLNAGLLDEIHIDLAPVLVGGGVRLFDNLSNTNIELLKVAEGHDVTHLKYRVISSPNPLATHLALCAQTSSLGSGERGRQ
jgi:dihydrofolate reductase